MLPVVLLPTLQAPPISPAPSEWDCLKVVGGRALTALGALTQAPTCLPFPESGSCLSHLSADKPALGQGPEDGTQICRVTLTLAPGWIQLLGAGTVSLHPTPLLSLPLLPSPCGPVPALPSPGTSLLKGWLPEGGCKRHSLR